jgi:hypothetical protein
VAFFYLPQVFAILNAMHKRGRIVGATALAIIGVSFIVLTQVGGGQLEAASVAETGYNWLKILVWSGAGMLTVSALMFISASAE